jgi:hypothetical protein
VTAAAPGAGGAGASDDVLAIAAAALQDEDEEQEEARTKERASRPSAEGGLGKQNQQQPRPTTTSPVIRRPKSQHQQQRHTSKPTYAFGAGGTVEAEKAAKYYRLVQAMSASHNSGLPSSAPQAGAGAGMGQQPSMANTASSAEQRSVLSQLIHRRAVGPMVIRGDAAMKIQPLFESAGENKAVSPPRSSLSPSSAVAEMRAKETQRMLQAKQIVEERTKKSGKRVVSPYLGSWCCVSYMLSFCFVFFFFFVLSTFFYKLFLFVIFCVFCFFRFFLLLLLLSRLQLTG